jgi:hypothetical protein
MKPFSHPVKASSIKKKRIMKHSSQSIKTEEKEKIKARTSRTSSKSLWRSIRGIGVIKGCCAGHGAKSIAFVDHLRWKNGGIRLRSLLEIGSRGSIGSLGIVAIPLERRKYS